MTAVGSQTASQAPAPVRRRRRVVLQGPPRMAGGGRSPLGRAQILPEPKRVRRPSLRIRGTSERACPTDLA